MNVGIIKCRFFRDWLLFINLHRYSNICRRIYFSILKLNFVRKIPDRLYIIIKRSTWPTRTSLENCNKLNLLGQVKYEVSIKLFFSRCWLSPRAHNNKNPSFVKWHALATSFPARPSGNIKLSVAFYLHIVPDRYLFHKFHIFLLIIYWTGSPWHSTKAM